ncbi:hypothetical protein J23TS9_13510 [Paenibacillus sp. J23TS9]|nr:hypothetical protein J23TS9_13510 [Paenibacillus sp. J23TS9]
MKRYSFPGSRTCRSDDVGKQCKRQYNKKDESNLLRDKKVKISEAYPNTSDKGRGFQEKNNQSTTRR